MNNNVLILELGGEGGSIQLATDGKTFLYSTNETTLLDFLAGELSEEELKHNSPPYSTFDEAFESLMARYPVFHLHPLTIHPQYLEKIKNIFLKYKSANIEGHQWGFDNWERFLGL
jgi:hypothetical protein